MPARHRPFRLTAPSPSEDDIQKATARALKIALPEEVEWTHFPAGFLKTKDRTSAAINYGRLIAFGFKKGRPDFQFVWKTRIYYIEMKDDDGRLSEEQKKFRDWCERFCVP